MKYVFCLFLIMFLTAFSDRDEEQIVWETFKPLSWDDFKGKPDKKSNAAAVTFSGISFGIETKADSIQFTIKSTFDCKRSWVNKTLANPYILQHEQLHFMITEIYARRLRMEIKKLIPKNQNLWQQEKSYMINFLLNQKNIRIITIAKPTIQETFSNKRNGI